MANAMASTLVRRIVSSAKSPSPAKLGNRTFHSSTPKKMADQSHSDESMYSNDYIHAPHMYDFLGMKHKRAKMGFMVFGSLTLGAVVPIYATHYQMVKSGGL